MQSDLLVLLIVVVSVCGLIKARKTWRYLEQVKRDTRADHELMDYLTTPLLTYYDTLERLHAPYCEEEFRAWMHDHFGEAETARYFATLHSAHDALMIQRKTRRFP